MKKSRNFHGIFYKTLPLVNRRPIKKREVLSVSPVNPKTNNIGICFLVGQNVFLSIWLAANTKNGVPKNVRTEDSEKCLGWSTIFLRDVYIIGVMYWSVYFAVNVWVAQMICKVNNITWIKKWNRNGFLSLSIND